MVEDDVGYVSSVCVCACLATYRPANDIVSAPEWLTAISTGPVVGSRLVMAQALPSITSFTSEVVCGGVASY